MEASCAAGVRPSRDHCSPGGQSLWEEEVGGRPNTVCVCVCVSERERERERVLGGAENRHLGEQSREGNDKVAGDQVLRCCVGALRQ